jgi:hypothetical protein
MVNVGNFYAAGTGTRRDLKEAALWYKRAYRQGLRDGASNLAVDLRNAGNLRGAVAWFRRAVALNDGDACIELAKMVQERRHGRSKAEGLLRRALSLSPSDLSDAGREEAERLLASLTEQRR